jgi:hypothetical protein
LRQPPLVSILNFEFLPPFDVSVSTLTISFESKLSSAFFQACLRASSTTFCYLFGIPISSVYLRLIIC